MGAVAGVALVAGAVISAQGQRKAGKTNQAIANHNAELGRQRAADSLERGDVLAKEAKQEFKRLASEQDVGFATQNVRLGVGISAEVSAENEYTAELESQRILNNAALEAWGFEQGATQSVLEGGLARQRGRFGSTATLLSGVGAGAAQIHGATRSSGLTPSSSNSFSSTSGGKVTRITSADIQ